ncbi:MAG: 4Fe-4S dicluster domain-containing protein [Clostridiales bacterium]|jgi:NADH dehydrogenase/NADH:ubiquinone oxidoreductase subunit G|nr:4Fe-4S dicluster domain-containing protein [Clostridiales bacterium]
MNITIDGKPCVCEPGEYLLDVARRNRIVIPTLCHHDGLPGQGCCRVCIVEVEIRGRRNIVTSCVYPVERECAVFTDSDAVNQQRRVVLALLRSRAPEADRINRLCKLYKVPEYERFASKSGEKCILCGLCVKACQSLGTGAIAAMNRGVEKEVSTPYDKPSDDCVGCGSCAAVCPTGAIEVKEDAASRAIWNREFRLRICERCGQPAGTMEELELAARKSGAEPSALCGECRKKAVADAMAATYGV